MEQNNAHAKRMMMMIEGMEDVSDQDKNRLKNAVGLERHILNIGLMQEKCNKEGEQSPLLSTPIQTVFNEFLEKHSLGEMFLCDNDLFSHELVLENDRRVDVVTNHVKILSTKLIEEGCVCSAFACCSAPDSMSYVNLEWEEKNYLFGCQVCKEHGKKKEIKIQGGQPIYLVKEQFHEKWHATYSKFIEDKKAKDKKGDEPPIIEESSDVGE